MERILLTATLTALLLLPGVTDARPGSAGETASPAAVHCDAPLNRLAFSRGNEWVTMKATPTLGTSPSSRKNNHWLTASLGEELMPLAPDELAELYASRNTYVGSIHRIKELERERSVEAGVVVRAKVWYETIRKDAPIEVFISGGGFRDGADPVIHDQIMISNSGLVQRMYETEHTGRQETKKVVDREALFQLVQWIAGNGFFEFDKTYECLGDDQYCLQRMEVGPEPIPLKVVVAIGPYRNVVNVPLFTPGSKQDYIAYPAELRKIVQAIYDFASL